MDEKDWILKNCKFAQMQAQPAPAQDPYQTWLASYNNLKVIDHQEDSETDREMHDDPNSFDPGTLPGAVFNTYSHDLKVQGNIVWNQAIADQFSDTLENSMKTAMMEGPPPCVEEMRNRGDSIQVFDCTAVPAGKDLFKVTMSVRLSGEREIDPDDYKPDRNDYDY